MKLFLLTVLAFSFAFSNCEPVEYAEKRDIQEPRAKYERPAEPSRNGTKGRVVGISDGDSIVVLLDGNIRKRVRLATIDAPENHQAFGKPSRRSLSDLIYNKEVEIATVDTDRYGRIVGEVYIGDLNVNVEQLRRGLAWHYKAHARQQKRVQREKYASAENEARSKRIGLWQDKNPTPPWDYRKKNPRN